MHQGNDYKRVLLVLAEHKKIPAKANALQRVAAFTHDSKLAEMAKNFGDIYPRWIFLKPEQRALLDELKEYCKAKIAEGKPEWQIEAEKNGWTPPA